MNAARQTRIGLTLAGAIVAAWLAIHVTGIFFWRPYARGEGEPVNKTYRVE